MGSRLRGNDTPIVHARSQRHSREGGSPISLPSKQVMVKPVLSLSTGWGALHTLQQQLGR